MKTITLIALLIAAPAGFCAAGAIEKSEAAVEPNAVLTLADAQALALLHNPRLAAYSWEVRASGARALQAGLRPNPELGVEVEEFGGSGSRRGMDGAETTVQISQLIERGGKAEKRRRAAELDRQLADRDYQSRRLDVLAETAGAFSDVLAAQENVDAAGRLLEITESQTEAVRQRVQAGKDMPLEQNKAEVLLAQVRTRHSQAVHTLENARRQLAAMWASAQPAFERARGRLRQIEKVGTYQALAAQLANNPDIARWEDEVNRSRAQEELAKAGGKQDWTVSAGVQRFNESDDNALVVGVSIPLPIFNRSQGDIAAARFNTRKVQRQQEAALTEAQAALAAAYAQAAIAYDQAHQMQTTILENARRAFEDTQEAWRQGKSDYLNVLDAQRTYFETQTDYIDALAAFHRAQADLRRLTGFAYEAAGNTQPFNQSGDEK